MTITQHAHIYSFHTSNFIFEQIIYLKFLSIPPARQWQVHRLLTKVVAKFMSYD